MWHPAAFRGGSFVGKYRLLWFSSPRCVHSVDARHSAWSHVSDYLLLVWRGCLRDGLQQESKTVGTCDLRGDVRLHGVQ